MGVSMDLVAIYTSRIGHLAQNTELFLRRKSLNPIETAVYRITDHFSGQYISNNMLYKMINRVIQIKDISTAEYLNLVKKGHKDCGMMSCMSNEFWEFDNIKPQLSFLPYEIKKGKDLLNKIGVGNEPYVCLHQRDALYLKQNAPKFDYSYHNYRDCSIANYLMAAEWLTSQGVYVIRMGEHVEETLVSDNPMIIDYASNFRSDFGDIFLPAHCMFFLGNTAGIFLVSSIFDVPSACANFVPFDMTPMLRKDIYIPKNIELSVSEQLKYTIEHFESGKVTSFENTPEQILDLTKEMFFTLKNDYNPTYSDFENQSVFRSLWNKTNRNYGYTCKISDAFLRDLKTKDLLS
jgi:putative glycosyltransferase (TIGR04372 family)